MAGRRGSAHPPSPSPHTLAAAVPTALRSRRRTAHTHAPPPTHTYHTQQTPSTHPPTHLLPLLCGEGLPLEGPPALIKLNLHARERGGKGGGGGWAGWPAGRQAGRVAGWSGWWAQNGGSKGVSHPPTHAPPHPPTTPHPPCGAPPPRAPSHQATPSRGGVSGAWPQPGWRERWRGRRACPLHAHGEREVVCGWGRRARRQAGRPPAHSPSRHTPTHPPARPPTHTPTRLPMAPHSHPPTRTPTHPPTHHPLNPPPPCPHMSGPRARRSPPRSASAPAWARLGRRDPASQPPVPGPWVCACVRERVCLCVGECVCVRVCGSV